ncbi:hypothetical protein RFI_13864, partial [Reticulomyxa filosa]
ICLKKIIKLINFHHNSPDLNPIEHFVDNKVKLYKCEKINNNFGKNLKKCVKKLTLNYVKLSLSKCHNENKQNTENINKKKLLNKKYFLKKFKILLKIMKDTSTIFF